MTQCTGENRQPPSQPGVSIAICCYNAAARLPETLRHLAAQRVDPSIPWEVMVVDNASTDGTAQVALREWTRPDVPMRVVPEPVPGTAYARMRAVRSATYEYVCFVDDDNWLAEDWVGIAFDFMQSNPEVAACQSWSKGAFSGPLPAWFAKFHEAYAITPENCDFGDVTWSPIVPWTAGLALRRGAWFGLIKAGFQPILSGRHANSMAAGEDSELCFALRMAGWKLWRDRRLFFQHCIEPRRIRWDYLRRLFRGFGFTQPQLRLYHSVQEPVQTGLLARLRASLPWQIYYFFRYSKKLGWHLLPATFLELEGDERAADYEFLLGHLIGVIKTHGRKREDMRKVRTLAENLKRLGPRPTACE